MRVAIIQARMGSTRLPGKVLLDLAGRPMLERVIERVRRCAAIDQVVLATTTEGADDAIVELAAARGWAVFRGSQDDVLSRYLGAARGIGARVVARVTSDCPLIDPEVCQEVMVGLASSGADYCSNWLRRSHPRGLDVEAFTIEALERAASEARTPYEREHVTPYLYRHPDLFRLHGVEAREDHSDHRWTVDTPEDLALAREVYAAFGADGPASWRDVLELFRRRPELRSMNAHIQQKS